MTLRTHDLPERFGIVAMSIQAASAEAYRRLLGRFMTFYAVSLCNPHWTEIVTIRSPNQTGY